MNQHPSILRALRDLVPERPLTRRESYWLGELQASRLRELLGVRGDPYFPSEAITKLPRVRVARSFDMDVSGSTVWNGSMWVINVNGFEPLGRQRFSLAHEFKHVVDHVHKIWLYGVTPSGTDLAERGADYFAGCLLIPKQHLKALFCTGRKVEELARIFGATPSAIAVRLSQVGLIDSASRCVPPSGRIAATSHGTGARRRRIAA